MNHGAVLGYTPSPGPVTRSAFPALPMVCHELLQRNPPPVQPEVPALPA